MAVIDNIFKQIAALPARKKTAAAAVLIIGIATVFLLYAWMQKVDYRLLYSNISEDDAASIIQALKEKKIPYKLESGGVILVPSDKVYDVRLQLAGEGLPHGGGVGFEIFDKTNFTTTEFVQKLNYKRALEGELARTIRSMTEVQQARVHLVIPERSIFALSENEPKPSASVFVSLRQGRRLSSSQVAAIVHLVSSGVEGLSPNNITLVDNKGELLTKPEGDSIIALSDSQTEYQNTIEKDMVSKIVSLLEPVVGKDKVRAKVSATIDFTRSERTEEKFDPEGVVVRSEQKSIEKSTSGTTGGIPGVASNLPGKKGQAGGASGGMSQKQDETINYETSKTVTRIIDSPAALKRLSIAILIDGILPSQQTQAEKAKQYTVRTEEDIKYYEDLTKKAVGFTPERGDQISIAVMPFEGLSSEPLPEVKKEYLPIILTVLKYLVPIIVAMLFFFVILKPLLRTIEPQPVEAPKFPVPQTTVEVGHTQPKEVENKNKRQEVIEWASKNPEQAAGLLKNWLEE